MSHPFTPGKDTMGDVLIVLLERMAAAQYRFKVFSRAKTEGIPEKVLEAMQDAVMSDFFLLHLGAMCFSRGILSREAALEAFAKQCRALPIVSSSQFRESARKIESMIDQHAGCWEHMEKDLLGKKFEWQPPKKGE